MELEETAHLVIGPEELRRRLQDPEPTLQHNTGSRRQQAQGHSRSAHQDEWHYGSRQDASSPTVQVVPRIDGLSDDRTQISAGKIGFHDAAEHLWF